MLEVDLDAMRRFVEGWTIEPLFVTVSGRTSMAFHRRIATWTAGLPSLAASRRGGSGHAASHAGSTRRVDDGTEVELVSHEAVKYLQLLLRNNGYILEQIFSPIVVQGQEFLDELRPLAGRCITRNHYHHYRGFIATQRKLIAKEEQKRAKPLLYAYRVLMTGIHL